MATTIIFIKDSIMRLINEKGKFRGGGDAFSFLVPIQPNIYYDGNEDPNQVVTDLQLQQMIDKLNAIYQGGTPSLPVRFYLLCRKNRKVDDAAFNGAQTLTLGLVSTDAIDLHIVRSLVVVGVSASGFFNPLSNVLVVKRKEINEKSTTFAHEMGHYFGLRHTHWGSVLSCDNDPSANNLFPNLAEFVNGFECDVRGDLICDTPADPCLATAGIVGGSNCTYFGSSTIVDGHGDRYHPDTHNLMSYSPCAETLSEQQKMVILIGLHDLFWANLGRVDPYIDEYEPDNSLKLAREMKEGVAHIHSLFNSIIQTECIDDVDYMKIDLEKYRQEHGLSQGMINSLHLQIEKFSGYPNIIDNIEVFEITNSGNVGKTFYNDRTTTLDFTISCADLSKYDRIGIKVTCKEDQTPPIQYHNTGRYSARFDIDGPKPVFVPDKKLICEGDVICIDGLPEEAEVNWKKSFSGEYKQISKTCVEITKAEWGYYSLSAEVTYDGCSTRLYQSYKTSNLDEVGVPLGEPSFDIIDEKDCPPSLIRMTIPNLNEYFWYHPEVTLTCPECEFVSLTPGNNDDEYYIEMVIDRKKTVTFTGMVLIEDKCGKKIEKKIEYTASFKNRLQKVKRVDIKL